MRTDEAADEEQLQQKRSRVDVEELEEGEHVDEEADEVDENAGEEDVEPEEVADSDEDETEQEAEVEAEAETETVDDDEIEVVGVVVSGGIAEAEEGDVEEGELIVDFEESEEGLIEGDDGTDDADADAMDGDDGDEEDEVDMDDDVVDDETEDQTADFEDAAAASCEAQAELPPAEDEAEMQVAGDVSFNSTAIALHFFDSLR